MKVQLNNSQLDPLKVNYQFLLINRELYLQPLANPGERGLQAAPVRKATIQDIELLKPQYELFKNNQDQLRTGTLLTSVFTPEYAKNYYDIDIYNVEQLASASDTVIDQHPKITDFKIDRKKAKDYLEYQHYYKEIGRRDENIAQLNERVRTQSIRIKELDAQVTELQHKLRSVLVLRTRSRTE